MCGPRGERGAIRRLLLWETGMLGVLAAVIGMASGLVFAGAHGCDQSRVLWLDDPAGVSVALPRAYPFLDFRGRRGRRYFARLARGTTRPGGELTERMKLARFFLIVLFATSALGADWKTAEPGWRYEFPRDHHAHRDFKTEWWYFTGNLFDSEGHRFGYELTFFRQGIRPQAERNPNSSRFIVDDLKFAHFALTDLPKHRFRFEQKTSRGAFGDAGFDDGQCLAWIDNWTLASNGDDAFDLMAATRKALSISICARLSHPSFTGENGVSVKASASGHASHYYSIPRLQTTGEFLVNGKSYPFRGESWFDHEWATSQLAKGQVGWDWIVCNGRMGRN